MVNLLIFLNLPSDLRNSGAIASGITTRTVDSNAVAYALSNDLTSCNTSYQLAS